MTRANKIVLTGALSVLVLSVGCKSSPPPSSTVATEASPGVSQSPKVPVIYLNQGWSQADREMYYWTSQGSTGFSYDIYLNMEVAGSQELFRSDANSERYGLITEAANPRTNPDALPIGLTKTVIADGRWKGEYIGITCAACHDSQLNYKGKRIRIDGGNGNSFDMMSYIRSIDAAMQETLSDSAKFDRLTARMKASSPEAKSALRQRLESEAATIHRYSTAISSRPPTGDRAGSTPSLRSLIGSRPTKPNSAELPTPLAPTKMPFLGILHRGRGTSGAAYGRTPSNATRPRQWECLSALTCSPRARTTASSIRPRCPSTSIRSRTPCNDWRLRNGRKRYLEKSTARKRRRARSYSPVTVRSATILTRIPGPSPTSTVSASRSRTDTRNVCGHRSGAVRVLRPYVITGQLGSHLPPPYTDEKFIQTGGLYLFAQQEVLNRSLAPSS